MNNKDELDYAKKSLGLSETMLKNLEKRAQALNNLPTYAPTAQLLNNLSVYLPTIESFTEKLRVTQNIPVNYEAIRKYEEILSIFSGTSFARSDLKAVLDNVNEISSNLSFYPELVNLNKNILDFYDTLNELEDNTTLDYEQRYKVDNVLYDNEDKIVSTLEGKTKEIKSFAEVKDSIDSLCDKLSTYTAELSKEKRSRTTNENINSICAVLSVLIAFYSVLPKNDINQNIDQAMKKDIVTINNCINVASEKISEQINKDAKTEKQDKHNNLEY